jgi:4-amino-4-deoxy-L-arabinose transferase-like glycosyltransferase
VSGATGELSLQRRVAAPDRPSPGRVSRVRRAWRDPRIVWLPVALISLVLAGLMVKQVLIPRPFYTGTNNVGVRSVVAGLEPGQTLCVPDLHLPAETGRIQMAVFAHRPSFAARLTVRTAGRSYSSRMTGAPGPTSLDYASAPIPETPGSPSTVPATVCISPLDGPIALGGMLELQANQVPARLDGSPVSNRVGVWFMPPAGTERSLLSQASTIFRRAALFRAGGVGAWTYPVLLFVLLPFTWALSACLLIGAVSARARLPRWFRSRAGWVLAVVAFANFGAWALITPSFNSPDEPEHFAYAQYLAETGHAPERTAGAKLPYSTDEVEALDAINVKSQAELTDARPPWLAVEQQAWERLQASTHPSDSDGGGYTVAASSHQPAYYAALAPAYLVGSSGSTFTQLTVMRLMSALMGVVVVLCAFGVMRELLPARPPLAALAAGLLVAYHPMFGFISGAVNNDSGVNAGAALTLYLLVRGLRRGLTVPLALALGAAVVATPAMKETGYEIYPVVIIGVTGMIWRRHRLRDLAAYGALTSTFLLARFGWKALQPLFYPTVGGHSGVNQGIVATEVVSLAEKMPGRFLVYLWELFLPQLSFMGRLFPSGWPFREVYVVRGWAAFGWYAWIFPNWVYTVIVYAMGASALLAIAAAIRNWQALRRRVFEALVILILPVCVLVAVEAAYFAPDGGRTAYAEQGRYIFPAIAALAVIAVGATFGVSRRWRPPLAVTMVIAMVALSYASQMLTLASAFT